MSDRLRWDRTFTASEPLLLQALRSKNSGIPGVCLAKASKGPGAAAQGLPLNTG